VFLPTTITASAPRSSRSLLTDFPIPLEFLAHVLPFIQRLGFYGVFAAHWLRDLLKSSSITRESTSPDRL
jgi:hypothetical protein